MLCYNGYVKGNTRLIHMNKTNKYLFAPAMLLSATVLSGVILMSNTASADNDSVVDQVSITVPISCTISGSGMTSHNASIPNGTYIADIGTTTLTAFCNDNSGFSIYATGYTGNEIGATNSNKLVGTNASNNATIDTGTNTTAGSPDVSNWAMKLTAPSSPTPTYPIAIDNGFNNYSSVPNSYTKVAHRASGTDTGTNAEGSTLTTTYAAYISKTQPADTYSGQVIYTLVHPESEEPLQPHTATSGCINYFANASTAVGQMGCQTISSSATSATLWASNFKRDGYGFAGWSDAYDYATNTNANFYGPNQDITFTAGQYTGNNNGLSLYAVWIKSTGSMQTDATTACNGLTQAPTPTNGTATLASVTALTDERDNNTYAIAKLADGKCWTIENLRLADKDSSNNDVNLTSTNTHNPSLPLTNTWWYSSTNDSDTNPTSNHLSATTDPTSTAWCQTNSSSCDDQSMLATNNTALFTSNTSSGYSASSNVYSYGNYYNWYSATAGNGTYSKSSGNTAGDICPAGWHLPTGTSSGEYYNLNYAINDNNNTEDSTASQKIRTYPNNFVYSGNVNGPWVNGRSSGGYYWSSSAVGSSLAYFLGFSSSYVDPGTFSYNKYIGSMVRCVSGV